MNEAEAMPTLWVRADSRSVPDAPHQGNDASLVLVPRVLEGTERASACVDHDPWQATMKDGTVLRGCKKCGAPR